MNGGAARRGSALACCRALRGEAGVFVE